MPRVLHERITEATTIDELDRVIDRLARELACLTALEALNDEEATVFSAAVGDLRVLLIRIWRAEEEGPGSVRRAHDQRTELCRMLRPLISDIDLTYQRLCTVR